MVKALAVYGIQTHPRDGLDVLLLREVGTRRVLPIEVTRATSQLLHATLCAPGPTTRPGTHALVHAVLGALGGRIQHALIHAEADGVYFTQIVVRRGDTVTTLDARPSDAVVLAWFAGAPVYVDADLLARNGAELSDDDAGDETDDEASVDATNAAATTPIPALFREALADVDLDLDPGASDAAR